MDEPIPAPGPGERYKLRLDSIPVSEKWIDDAIRRAGGARLDELHKFPEGVENCDYLLPGDILVELKILEKDSFEPPERQAKLVEFFTSLGLVADTGISDVNSDQLRSEDRARFYDIVYGNIPGVIRKAERQIESTAKFLGMKTFTGVILLVNKECETLESEGLRRYAAEMIARKKCQSLQHAVLFSCLPAVTASGRPSVGMIVEPSGDPAFDAAIEGLGNAIKSKVEEAVGRKLDQVPADAGPLTNLRDHRSFTTGNLTVTLKSPTRALIEENLGKMKARPPE